MKKILVIGSISIDNVVYTKNLPQPGMTVYGEAFLSNIGGKGANQACAIKYLGGDVEFFGSIGDSLVAFTDGTIVKVHVHTKEPDKAIAYALQYGEFIRFKMENMTLQHNQTLIDKSKSVSLMARPESKVKRDLAIIAVVPNEETAEVYRSYGVTDFVFGGPYMNPDAEDFLKAFSQTNARTVLVFPNNKNEILVAESASKMCSDVEILIVPTADIAQGISCCSVLDAVNLGAKENVERANATLQQSKIFTLYRASRETKFNGIEIHHGDHLYVTEADTLHRGENALDCFQKWFDAEKGEHGLLIILASSHIDESTREAITSHCAKRDDFMEVLFYDIGDFIYDMYAILD